MKNRALLLCLKNNIQTAEEYALSIGTSIDVAEGILKEQIVIPEELITRSCELFGVKKEYFLCEI